jgi:glycyl-tRNA synthetase
MAAYDEEEVRGETRVVLRFHPRIAPYKAAVLPLSKKPELTGPAQELVASLRSSFVCDYDETQSIGRRYRRQDELGTPYCITYDFDSLTDGAVTIRERDSMEQERVAVDEVASLLRDRLT